VCLARVGCGNESVVHRGGVGGRRAKSKKGQNGEFIYEVGWGVVVNESTLLAAPTHSVLAHSAVTSLCPTVMAESGEILGNPKCESNARPAEFI
jgi:hypothetical protein